MRETQLAVKLKHSLIRTLYHILSMWHRHEFFQWSNRHKLRCNGSKERVTRPSLIKGRGRYTVGPQAQTTPTHSLIPLITHPIEKTAAPPPTFYVLTVELELQHPFSQFSFSTNLMRKHDGQFCWPQIIVNDNSRRAHENVRVLKAEEAESTGNKPHLDLICERPTDIHVKYWETKEHCFSQNETNSNCDLVTVNAHNLWILVKVSSCSLPPPSYLFGVE